MKKHTKSVAKDKEFIMPKPIEYGIRGKSQKNIVNVHSKSGKAIEYAKIRIPKSDFDRREEIGHSAEVNPNP